MSPVETSHKTLDPVEHINGCLERAWQNICTTYDASTSLPEVQALFDQADISQPCHAAETVVVNMLLEVMESICRFSPWYTKPPRAFGLTSVRDGTLNRTRWSLAPEAAHKWEPVLGPISDVIQKYNGLLQAILLVDGLMARSTPDDPTITACCSCIPPRAIQIKQSVLVKAEIICDQCKQPYLY